MPSADYTQRSQQPYQQSAAAIADDNFMNYRFAALSFLTIHPIYGAEYYGPIIGQELVGSVRRCVKMTASAV